MTHPVSTQLAAYDRRTTRWLTAGALAMAAMALLGVAAPQIARAAVDATHPAATAPW